MLKAKQILCFGLPVFAMIKLLEGHVLGFLVLAILYYFLVYGISKYNLEKEKKS